MITCFWSRPLHAHGAWYVAYTTGVDGPSDCLWMVPGTYCE
jgi:hypothetical protein